MYDAPKRFVGLVTQANLDARVCPPRKWSTDNGGLCLVFMLREMSCLPGSILVSGADC